jgi:hypothetical protein
MLREGAALPKLSDTGSAELARRSRCRDRIARRAATGQGCRLLILRRRVRDRQDVVVTMLNVPVVVVSALANASVAAPVPHSNAAVPLRL